VTLPVVWIPEANKDLLEARAWYANIRPALGERFAVAVETTVEALAEHPLQFPLVHRSMRRAGVAASQMAYSSRCSSIGLWYSPASTEDATQRAGKRVSSIKRNGPPLNPQR